MQCSFPSSLAKNTNKAIQPCIWCRTRAIEVSPRILISATADLGATLECDAAIPYARSTPSAN